PSPPLFPYTTLFRSVPITLIVVLLGAPPVAVFAFFMAAVMAKHLTHAIPTALMGVPGDTMATPMMEHANFLRRLGMPHIALRKIDRKSTRLNSSHVK